MEINFDSALTLLKEKINAHNAKNPLVIAIDGKSASGKTTFANLLGATVIHTDDFFRPRNEKGVLEISEYSGNFDTERFKNEVVANIKSGKAFKYGVFDCKMGAVTHTITVETTKCIVVEGAYSTHPFLGDYADIKLFFDISEELQKQRIIKRNGESGAKAFFDIWIPAEERYIASCLIKENSNIIVSTEV